MNSLYKRIITLGMVSVTAVLAWIYCMVTFPKQLVYLAVISLVVVVSLYALLNALTGLNIEKEKKLQAYFRQTTNELVEKIIESGDSEEAYRLSRATYVQIRKGNQSLSAISEEIEHSHEQNIVAAKAQHDEVCMLMADYINKATKVLVKYNETNNDRLVEALESLALQVAELKLDNVNISAVQTQPSGETIAAAEPVVVEEAAADTVEETVAAEPDIVEEATAAVEEPDDEEDESIILAQRAIQALNGGVDSAPEPEAAPVSEDPNKQLNPDEIAALFAASKEERKAESDDDFKVEEHPEAMDQGLIDALLGMNPDVIPFPAAAEPEPEVASAPAPVSDDPNKQLSADEIAALFAAAAPEPEKKAEPEPAPVPLSDDPNKQLSPDEIAALFSSMSG